MTNRRDVAVFVGSLRKESFNRKIANALAAVSPENLALEIVEIGQLPLYNQDLDANPPETWAEFRRRVKSADGFLFVTPEYNRSIPAPLKNAIDVGSRPYGSSAWEGKPGGVVSVSPGGLGAFGANHHLRQCFVFLNVFTLQQPELYISNVTKVLGPDGKVTDEKMNEQLKNYMTAFSAWVERHAAR